MRPALLTGALGLTIAVLGCVTISFAVQVPLQRRLWAAAAACNTSFSGPRDLLVFSSWEGGWAAGRTPSRLVRA